MKNNNLKDQNRNALATEASLYLRQHATNPVNWVPWSKEAFERAQKEDKLVLISIGYSACHWCHVMEHESFENEEIAAYMNAHYVCIKVDREERPDVDDVYMTAVQLMTKSGGWPLNCFTLPDGRPIYGGTYFPSKDWLQVLKMLVKTKNEAPDRIEEYASKMEQAINLNNPIIELPQKSNAFDSLRHIELIKSVSESFDKVHGGHLGAPKFPMPVEWNFYLESSFYAPQPDLDSHVRHTLYQMSSGAMYDQIRGGFARYSVDERWKIPHFEKMLYDNGQLLALYAKAYKKFGDDYFLQLAQEIKDFLIREMYNPKSGGFYAALDADSEGQEGKYYVFTEAEYKTAIRPKLWPLAKAFLGINQNGYWEEENYVATRPFTDQELCETFKLTPSELDQKKQSIKSDLRQLQENRIRPGLDDKEIASWNAQCYLGLIELYKADPNSKLWALIENGFTFLEKHLEHEGELLRYFKPDAKPILATLDDYANQIRFCIALYEISGQSKHLKKAIELLEKSEHKFLEKDQVLFNKSALNGENQFLISNPIECHDNVEASANSVMCENYFLLSKLCYSEHYENRFRNMLSAMEENMISYPRGYFNWWRIYNHAAHNFCEVGIIGPKAQKEQENLHRLFLPNYISAQHKHSTNFPELLKGKMAHETTMIYVCRNKSCLKPTSQLQEAIEQIR